MMARPEGRAPANSQMTLEGLRNILQAALYLVHDDDFNLDDGEDNEDRLVRNEE